MVKRSIYFIAAAVFVLVTLLPRVEWIFTNPEEDTSPPVNLAADENRDAFKQYFSKCVEIGETFAHTSVTVTDFSGTLECTVTDIRLVSEEVECPPREWFDSARLDTQASGWVKPYYYEEWFTENGAFDKGCRLILVDMTVENIDARAYIVDEGGEYYDPYVFSASSILRLMDVEHFYEKDELFSGCQAIGFSLLNSYAPTNPPENDPEPTDPFDFVIEPGDMVSFTLVFPLQHNADDAPQEVSKLVLGEQYEPRMDDFYIELGLEEEAR